LHACEYNGYSKQDRYKELNFPKGFVSRWILVDNRIQSIYTRVIEAVLLHAKGAGVLIAMDSNSRSTCGTTH